MTSNIFVKSSIKNVVFSNPFPELILLYSVDIKDIKPAIRVLDENGKGINGKVPKMKIID